MSEDAKPPEAQPEPHQPAKPARRFPFIGIFQALRAENPVSLAALVTAVVASIVAVVQTGFMYAARNDEVEAALRAEQLRSCVKYRNAGFAANTRAQQLALDGIEASGDSEFEDRFADYNSAIGELMYLLPASNGDALERVEQTSLEAYFAYEERDQTKLRELTISETQDLPWSNSHNVVLDACEAIITEVRDR